MEGILSGFLFSSKKGKPDIPKTSVASSPSPKAQEQHTKHLRQPQEISESLDSTAETTNHRSTDMRLSKNAPSNKSNDEDFDIPADPVVPSFSSNTPNSIGSSSPASSSRPASTPSAVIGSKISFKGDLSGEEDLLIQGRVEGTVDLKGNHLTIGNQGVVKANLMAKTITIQGTVEGDVIGQERIEIKSSSNVKGNLVAARVTLEDGAKFRGSIDMESTGSSLSSGSKPVTESTSTINTPPAKDSSTEKA